MLNQQGRDKLRSFHNRCARFWTGRYITKINDEWIYPDTTKSLELAYLLPIEEYMTKRKNTIQIYACETDIYEECIAKQLYIKADNTLQWWDNIIQYIETNEEGNNINNNLTNETENNAYDPDEIEIEWWTEEI